MEYVVLFYFGVWDVEYVVAGFLLIAGILCQILSIIMKYCLLLMAEALIFVI